jgi:RNA polymerase sigma-70 factor, ECF subfamily
MDFLFFIGNHSANHASYRECRRMTGASFESVVRQYYEPLYRFAFSLAQTEADACDLTQQTFYVWATKGHQLRDPNSTKTWLFTTLHRVFLQSRRRATRFPHEPLDELDDQLPCADPVMANDLDWAQVLEALGRVEEHYQAAVALFYLEDCSYREIAEILEVPIGTVKSRLARGLGQLKKILIQTGAPGRIGKAQHE